MSECHGTDLIAYILLFSILARLGGCLGVPYSPKEKLDNIERKLDTLIREVKK